MAGSKKTTTRADTAFLPGLARLSGKKQLRVGIMGGTFNPIHYGHLVCAEQARCGFRLDHVVFVPSGLPPHKDVTPVAPAEHRYLMTVLAVSGNPFFSVSRIEVEREGPSYAIDTINHFGREFRAHNPAIHFITGCDAVMEILSWRSPEAIMKAASIIAASRPGYDFNRLKTTVGAANFRKIKQLEVSALAISSTDIRGRVRDGRTIKYLLPDAVEQHILKHGLYADGPAAKKQGNS